jgi:hypothetical protein
VLAGCGTAAKPLASATGSPVSTVTPIGHGVVDDQRLEHAPCIRAGGLTVTFIGNTDMRIGPLGGPTVHFTTSPGAAQNDQMNGSVEAAEVIGTAELYPATAGDSELKIIEDCLSSGVTG